MVYRNCLQLTQAQRTKESTIISREFCWDSLATIADDQTNSPTFRHSESDEPIYINNSFQSALSLLQANVLALCLKAGISPTDMWPPLAMLPNICVLRHYCYEKLKLMT